MGKGEETARSLSEKFIPLWKELSTLVERLKRYTNTEGLPQAEIEIEIQEFFKNAGNLIERSVTKLGKTPRLVDQLYKHSPEFQRCVTLIPKASKALERDYTEFKKVINRFRLWKSNTRYTCPEVHNYYYNKFR